MATMRHLNAALVATVVVVLAAPLLSWALVGAASAQAGTVAFSSARCVDEADRQARPDRYFPPNPPACAAAIWVVEDDGTGLRRLTTPAPYKGHAQPAWSPLGTHIAYTAEGAVWVAEGDGSHPKRIVEGDNPTWSPDGLSIVVSRDTTTRDSRGETILGDRELFAVAVDGLVIRQLTNTPEDESLPRLSGDGTKVLFTRTTSYAQDMTMRPTARNGLFSLNPINGREERLLATDIPFDAQFGARFSPDGRRLAFSVGLSIYTMNADGSDLRRRTEPHTALDATWSGLDSLVYVRPAARTSGLERFDLRTGGRRQLTPMEVYGPGDPDWAPAGGLASLTLPPDKLPPAMSLFDARTGRQAGSRRRPAAAAAAVRSVRARDLKYVAADASGLRTARVAFGHRGRKRCRFVGRRRYSKPRSCRRPIYQRARAWAALTARLRPGPYVVYMRTKDARGNRSRRARHIYLRIRR